MLRSPLLSASLLFTGLLAGAVLGAPAVRAGERASLETQVLELTSRVAALEQGQGVPSRITAPFTVMGKDGKPILHVTDNVATADWARVTIGSSPSGHSLVAVSTDGKPGGAGALLTAEADGRGSLTIRNSKGEPIVRAAEIGTGDGILHVHDRSNRGLFRVTPSLANAAWARVTVGAGIGGMSALMVSSDGEVGGGGALLTAEAGTSAGTVSVRDNAGQVLASLTAGDGGVLVLRDDFEKTRVRLNQKGMTLLDASERETVNLGVDPDQGKDAALIIKNSAGMTAAVLRAMGETGALSVMNASGKPVAGLLGSGAAGGMVAVTNTAGAMMARMGVTDDGRGLVQVHAKAGGLPIAVLTQALEGDGGLLQISNSGRPVANLTVGTTGGGYLQLTNASGVPTVEAGTLPDGHGTVRAGPNYLCLPAAISGPISFLPDCIMGSSRRK